MPGQYRASHTCRGQVEGTTLLAQTVLKRPVRVFDFTTDYTSRSKAILGAICAEKAGACVDFAGQQRAGALPPSSPARSQTSSALHSPPLRAHRAVSVPRNANRVRAPRIHRERSLERIALRLVVCQMHVFL